MHAAPDRETLLLARKDRKQTDGVCHLWRHVCDGPTAFSKTAVFWLGAEEKRRAKVCDTGLTRIFRGGGEQYVLRFEVEVHNPLLVDVRQRRSNLQNGKSQT